MGSERWAERSGREKRFLQASLQPGGGTCAVFVEKAVLWEVSRLHFSPVAKRTEMSCFIFPRGKGGHADHCIRGLCSL